MGYYSFECEGKFYENASPGTILKILFGKSVKSDNKDSEKDALRGAAMSCTFRLRYGRKISKDSLYYFLASNFIDCLSSYERFRNLKKKYNIPDKQYELCTDSACRERYKKYSKVFEEVLKDLKLTRV